MKKNPLPVVLFTVFLDLLGVGILIPVIPLLLGDSSSEYYLLNPGTSMATGYIMLGFLSACFPLGQFFASPILGQLSDRFGRRRILAITLSGTFLSYLVFAYGIITKNIPILFISRLIDGFTGGSIAVAQASLADVTKPQDRAKTFGLIGAAFGLGFILGPFIGGKLADPHFIPGATAATPFWFAAILSFLSVMSVIFMLPETHLTPTRNLKVNWAKSIHNILGAVRLKPLRPFYSTLFLFQSGFSFFITFFSIFLINRFGFHQGQIGNFFAFVGLWVVITQGFVTRILSRYFKEPQVIRFSIILCGMMILAYFLPVKSWQLFLVVPFFAMGNGLSNANLSGLLSRSVDGSIQGEILGISSSIQALAQAIPPILSGFIASQMDPTATLWVSGLVVIFSGILFNLTFKPFVHPLHQKQ